MYRILIMQAQCRGWACRSVDFPEVYATQDEAAEICKKANDPYADIGDRTNTIMWGIRYFYVESSEITEGLWPGVR